MENKTAQEAAICKVLVKREYDCLDALAVVRELESILNEAGYRITKEPAHGKGFDAKERVESIVRSDDVYPLVGCEGPVGTQGHPEVSGVYWVTDPQGEDYEVVKVSVMGSGVVYSDLAGETHEPITDFKPLCWWYGPITAPKFNHGTDPVQEGAK